MWWVQLPGIILTALPELFLLNPQSNLPLSEMPKLSLSSFHRGENQGIRRVSNLPKATTSEETEACQLRASPWDSTVGTNCRVVPRSQQQYEGGARDTLVEKVEPVLGD